MTIALWCVLAAAVLPLLMTGIAKTGGNFDNADPRVSQQNFKGFQKRAHGAHQNGFEAFPLFAAAVIIAEMKLGPLPLINLLALVFVALRVVYCGLYLANLASLRTLVWTLAFATSVAILTMPAWHQTSQ